MTTTSIPLDYALTPVRKPVMPRGAVAVFSFLWAGLPSVLLCGRRRIGLVLGLNGLILAAAASLAFTWPLILSNEDYAGWSGYSSRFSSTSSACFSGCATGVS